MATLEYKTLALSVTGLRRRGSLVPDLEEELNAVAADGWRVIEVIPPSFRGFSKTIVILEREAEPA